MDHYQWIFASALLFVFTEISYCHIVGECFIWGPKDQITKFNQTFCYKYCYDQCFLNSALWGSNEDCFCVNSAGKFDGGSSQQRNEEGWISCESLAFIEGTCGLPSKSSCQPCISANDSQRDNHSELTSTTSPATTPTTTELTSTTSPATTPTTTELTSTTSPATTPTTTELTSTTSPATTPTTTELTSTTSPATTPTTIAGASDRSSNSIGLGIWLGSASILILAINIIIFTSVWRHKRQTPRINPEDIAPISAADNKAIYETLHPVANLMELRQERRDKFQNRPKGNQQAWDVWHQLNI